MIRILLYQGRVALPIVLGHPLELHVDYHAPAYKTLIKGHMSDLFKQHDIIHTVHARPSGSGKQNYVDQS